MSSSYSSLICSDVVMLFKRKCNIISLCNWNALFGLRFLLKWHEKVNSLNGNSFRRFNRNKQFRRETESFVFLYTNSQVFLLVFTLKSLTEAQETNLTKHQICVNNYNDCSFMTNPINDLKNEFLGNVSRKYELVNTINEKECWTEI